MSWAWEGFFSKSCDLISYCKQEWYISNTDRYKNPFHPVSLFWISLFCIVNIGSQLLIKVWLTHETENLYFIYIPHILFHISYHHLYCILFLYEINLRAVSLFSVFCLPCSVSAFLFPAPLPRIRLGTDQLGRTGLGRQRQTLLTPWLFIQGVFFTGTPLKSSKYKKVNIG